MTNLEITIRGVEEFMVLKKYVISAQQLVCRPLFLQDLVRTGRDGDYSGSLNVEGEKAIVLTGIRWAKGLRVKVYKGSVLSGFCIAWLSSDVPLLSGFPVLLPGMSIRYVLESDIPYKDVSWDFSGYIVEKAGENICPDVL